MLNLYTYICVSYYPLISPSPYPTYDVSSEAESCPLDHSVLTRSEILSPDNKSTPPALSGSCGDSQIGLIESPPSSPTPTPQNDSPCGTGGADGSSNSTGNHNRYRDTNSRMGHTTTRLAGGEMPAFHPGRPPSPMFRASCGASPNGAFGAIILNPLRALFQALVHGPALWFMNQGSHEAAATRRPHDRRHLDEAVKFIRLVSGGPGERRVELVLIVVVVAAPSLYHQQPSSSSLAMPHHFKSPLHP